MDRCTTLARAVAREYETVVVDTVAEALVLREAGYAMVVVDNSGIEDPLLSTNVPNLSVHVPLGRSVSRL